MIYVKHAEYIEDYKVMVVFSNRKKAIIDLKNTIFNDHRKIFLELKNKAKFKKFKTAASTIVWDNGLDLAPEYLYSQVK